MFRINANFFSNVLGMHTQATILLNKTCDEPMPVIWLLHGHSDDHTTWHARTSIEKYISPYHFAIVMPNAHRSYYTNQKSGLRYEDFFACELPEIVRTHMPIISAKREDNYIGGLSMGGYGAFKLALKHPEKFGAAFSFSGVLDISAHAEAPSAGIEQCLAFGETPRGTDDDTMALIEKIPLDKCPRLYQACGTEDFLYEGNIRFRDRARELGLPHTYREGPGTHNWYFWDEYFQYALAWILESRQKS